MQRIVVTFTDLSINNQLVPIVTDDVGAEGGRGGAARAVGAGALIGAAAGDAGAGAAVGAGLALLAGFYGAAVIGAISWLTWDWKAYYGLPKTSDAWYDNMGVSFIMVFFWTLFLLWPVLVELLRSLIRRNRTGNLTAA